MFMSMLGPYAAGPKISVFGENMMTALTRADWESMAKSLRFPNQCWIDGRAIAAIDQKTFDLLERFQKYSEDLEKGKVSFDIR